jgi:hypothetical protein
MKKNNFTILKISVLGCLAALSSLSFNTFAANYVPASFGNALETLQSKITLPQTFGEGVQTVAVYCQADVLTTGDVSKVNCYENSSLVSMQGLTQSALSSANFTPASIDGTSVPVRMQFRVVYSLSGTQEKILLLPNLGTLQAKYGVNYIAPQERLDKSDWYLQYSTKNHGDGKLFFADTTKLTRIMANVKIDGDVESVSTIEAANRRTADANQIESGLKRTAFIPGFVENKPTAMHYIAVVNYQ